MATIYVDGKKYAVSESNNLLEACLSIGMEIPYLCWHPALGSVGACRLCAVKLYRNNAKDTDANLVMSCMTPATDGTRIAIIDDEAKQFRKTILELLMINHPHDCPVCEEAGHCHLQDMTVITNQYIRRYRFTKRTYRNQYLGPFISHHMNRCIACYRCVRYYNDYADGHDFGVYGCNNNLYFGRQQEGMLENEFSGNLVEICPTGVFIDKTHSKRYNRKWDMQFAPSVCLQCSIGCNISPGERYGELRRIENRYNGSINHYFLCDRGRFGYGYVNRPDRPRQPLQRHGNDWIVLTTVEQAIKKAAEALRKASKIIGIGSPRASIESNFALRELVSKENFYTGLSGNEQDLESLILHVLRNSGIHTPSLREIESYDAVLILGEDITQTGARMALAVRQAIKGKKREIATVNKVANWHSSAINNIGKSAKYKLFITNVDLTKLDDIATWSYCAPVVDQARLGFAIAHAIDNTAPAVTDLNNDNEIQLNIVVNCLVRASKPLIISGSHAGSLDIIAAATNIARALKCRGSNVGLSFITSGANSLGLAMIGGGSLDDALLELENGTVDSVIVMENDIYRHALVARINNALAKVKTLIVVDHQYTAIQKKANFLLSAASFAESNGTIVNQEGRAQRFFKIYDPTYYNPKVIMQDSWRWLHALHSTYRNKPVVWTKLDDIIDAVVQALPILAGIKYAAPDASFRIHGQKLAREPHCYSGRTAIRADISVHEPRASKDDDTMFAFSMEGYNAPLAPRQQIAFVWSPGWNSPQAWNKFQDKIGGYLRYGDPGVRLITAGDSTIYDWFMAIPSAFIPDGSTWRIAPYWHLFGSEETSQRSDVIQERMLPPSITINSTDATRLGINRDTWLKFTCSGQEWCLPVQFSDSLSAGQIGLPLGYPGIPPILVGFTANNLRPVTPTTE